MLPCYRARNLRRRIVREVELPKLYVKGNEVLVSSEVVTTQCFAASIASIILKAEQFSEFSARNMKTEHRLVPGC